MIKYDDKKCTAKTWAAESALSDLELAFDYFYERREDEWNAMTEKEQKEVSLQMRKLEERCRKILMKASKF